MLILRQMIVAHSFLETPIGNLHVYASEEALVSVTFHPHIEQMLPASELTREAIQQLKSYFDGRRQTFELPLTPEGTDFQKEVWEQLKAIPYGRTKSYLDIAEGLGDRNATRAVGSANGKNPIAIIIPCHRVVGTDGSLTGYAGGKHRKAYLLQLESGGVQGILF